ncbi:MAG: hypothetical protein WCK31_03845 [bacterium]
MHIGTYNSNNTVYTSCDSKEIASVLLINKIGSSGSSYDWENDERTPIIALPNGIGVNKQIIK